MGAESFLGIQDEYGAFRPHVVLYDHICSPWKALDVAALRETGKAWPMLDPIGQAFVADSLYQLGWAVDMF